MVYKESLRDLGAQGASLMSSDRENGGWGEAEAESAASMAGSEAWSHRRGRSKPMRPRRDSEDNM